MRTFSLKKAHRLLALAGLLAGCGGGSATRRPAVESAERQFTAPAEGDLIAIFTTSLGEIRRFLPGRCPDGGGKFCWPGPHRLL